jgi:hypothetical protein
MTGIITNFRFSNLSFFNVKSKFDYIDKNKQKSEIANNDKFEKRKLVMMPVIFKRFVGPKLLKNFNNGGQSKYLLKCIFIYIKRWEIIFIFEDLGKGVWF